MSKNQPKLSREEAAHREAGRTNVSRRLSRGITFAFLALIVAVPLSQHVIDLRATRAGARHGWPQAYSIFTALPEAAEVFRQAEGSLWARVRKANASLLAAITGYEDDLEKQSALNQALIGPVQFFQASRFGQGNEKVYLGKDRWLFFRPDIDQVTGPGFLEPWRLAARSATGSETAAAPQPDPRKAVLDFARQLDKRGIRLLLVPAPAKPSVHPEQFTARWSPRDPPPQNPSFERFKRDVAAAGVLVFDPALILRQAFRHTGKPQYLSTDTHWTPDGMERSARELAAFIETSVTLRPGAEAYTRTAVAVTNLGDVAAMLQLPAGQDWVREEPVVVRQVNAPRDGLLWQPDESAEILVLGDSFANIYAMGEMGWGESAGFVQQLSYYLKRPLDALTRNDAGAYATRETLARKLRSGQDRLAGKKLVVWEFAARELATGDWKLLDLSLGTAPESRFVVPEKGTDMVVEGTVAARTPAPKPGSVPYKDHVVSVLLEDLRRDGKPLEPGSRALVFLFSMIDNKWQPPARYREGQAVTLRLENWQEVEGRYGSFNRSEFDDENLLLESPCWGSEPEAAGAPDASAK
jgi:alginate O-acetyltransferase complex protein AlgJ